VIEDRNLKAGTKLVARYKGKDYECKVVETKDGLRYQMVDDRGEAVSVKSPSAIGSYIMGGSACNGWRFWSIEGTEPKPKAAKATPTADFRRIPGGRAWCNGCAAAFKVEAGTTPPTCPEGHIPDGATPEPEKEGATA
jgi:hypothetical protein